MILVINPKHDLFRFICDLNKDKAQCFEFSAFVDKSDYEKVSDLELKIPKGYYCSNKDYTCPYFCNEGKTKCLLLSLSTDDFLCLINKVKICKINENA